MLLPWGARGPLIRPHHWGVGVEEEKLPSGSDRLFTATDHEHTKELLRSAWEQLEKVVRDSGPAQSASAA